MIYVDTSVALAHLLSEDRRPPAALWAETLVTSRLLEYEAWTHVHRRGLTASHGDALRAILGRLAMLELDRTVLRRALEPFPVPVRTLDAIHLASIDFLRAQGQSLTLASYDQRLGDAAKRIGIELAELEGSPGGT